MPRNTISEPNESSLKVSRWENYSPYNGVNEPGSEVQPLKEHLAVFILQVESRIIRYRRQQCRQGPHLSSCLVWLYSSQGDG